MWLLLSLLALPAFAQTGSIGDRVFDDVNANGVEDAGDSGLDGQFMFLWSGTCPGGGFVDAVFTSFGNYLFSNLAAGDYCVELDTAGLPPGSYLTTAANPLDVTIGVGENHVDADIGYKIPGATIGDRVFEDRNGNGVDDAEPGIATVTVDLRTGNCAPLGPIIDTQVTDSTGAYDFIDLAPGTYCVDVNGATVPPGPLTAGAPEPRPVTVVALQDFNTADFGYQLTGGSIGDLIWEDTNENGIQDGLETGVGGIEVELQDGVCIPGTNCPTRISDVNGFYMFNGLAAGNYNLAPINLPAGGSVTSAFPIPVVLGVAQHFVTADFGVHLVRGLSGCMWEDLDYDGIRDPGENYKAPDEGLTVSYVGTFFPFPSGNMKLDAFGCFEFSDLQAGDYKLAAELGQRAGGFGGTPGNAFENGNTQYGTAGMRWHTLKNVGAESNDNDFGIGTGGFGQSSTATAYTDAVTHDGFTTVENIDVGTIRSPEIGDLVFHDLDGDGIQDSGEPGVPGVRVELWEPAGVEPYYSTYTRFDGTWRIGEFSSGRIGSLTAQMDKLEADMVPGDWYVKYVLPAGSDYSFSPKDATVDTDDSDANALGVTDNFNLSSNTNFDRMSDPDFDAGLVRSCSTTTNKIEGLVFQDYNTNGRLDPQERTFAGTVVTAYNTSDGVVDSAVTAANGTYSLTVPDGQEVRVEFSSLAHGSLPGPAGAHGGGTVQFLTSPVCDADLAIVRPQEHCQADPRVATTCYVRATGDQSLPALVDVPWDISDTYPPFGQGGFHHYPATATEVGSVYGLAYQASSRSLFAGAMASAETALPPDGLGAIYRYDYDTDTVSLFIDLAAEFLAEYAIVDYSGSVADPVPINSPLVLKVGLGDIELSADQQTLWALNLADGYQELLEIPIGAPPTAPAAAAIGRHAFPLNQGDCATDTDIRPFALGVNRWDPTDDKVYVGAVCSNESLSHSLRGYIYTWDGATWAQVLNFPFNYLHYGDLNQNFFSAWNSGGADQPVIVDIEFDGDDLVLGIRSREGDMNHSGFTANGDLLRACSTGPGTWALESNGTCGGVTTLGENTIQGVGGGEYYFGDANIFYDAESLTGGIATAPGFSEIVAGVKGIYSAAVNGMSWFTDRGDKTRDYGILSGHGDVYGKTNGLGDLEVLCDLPPIEIGNRVWYDYDENGIQNPGEAPIANVALTLLDSTCTNVGTVTTSSEGEYYFVSAGSARAAEAGAAHIAAVAGGILSNSTYYVQVDSSNFSGGGALENREVSAADQGAEQHDSDAEFTSCGGTRASFIGAVIQTGTTGGSTHQVDLGFGDTSVLGSIGDTVWFDADRQRRSERLGNRNQQRDTAPLRRRWRQHLQRRRRARGHSRDRRQWPLLLPRACDWQLLRRPRRVGRRLGRLLGDRGHPPGLRDDRAGLGRELRSSRLRLRPNGGQCHRGLHLVRRRRGWHRRSWRGWNPQRPGHGDRPWRLQPVRHHRS